MDSLLLEIGVEEIPVRYIKPAIKSLSLNLSKQLNEVRIDHGFIEMFGTPRRLAVLVKDVSSKQKNNTERFYGPSEKIGLDNNGNYCLPAIKFANKIGVSLNQLEIVTTKKGSYISAKKTEFGEKTEIVLKNILPELILRIPFPKNMSWSNLPIRFARPIRTIVALLGTKVIKFVIGNSIKSSANSTGHMIMNPRNVLISDADSYSDIMKEVGVIANIEERRAMTYQAIIKAANSIGGNILVDDALLNEVTNLVEFPVAVAGKFDIEFLDMPNKILINVLREQQRYFAVINSSGDLIPCFVAVNNTLANNMEKVTTGHERVLRARLSDARFFYDSDNKESMEVWVKKLKGLHFHNKLGSMYDKVIRIKSIASYLTNLLDIDLTKEVLRASYLCKADLVSKVVTEFPKLQGFMGSIYARLAGESKGVYLAIQEHYWPSKSGGRLPNTKIGAIVSIADKIDSICGFFSIGLLPTGVSDPYALRRKGIGLLRTIRLMKVDLSLKLIVERSLELYSNKANSVVVVRRVCDFLKNRFSILLLNEGYSEDIIRAVISVSFDNIIDVEIRVSAIEKIKTKDDFIFIIRAFKRIENILQKAEYVKVEVSKKLFKNSSETILYEAYCDANNKVDYFIANNQLDKFLEIMISLSKLVDFFFDTVMVMVEEKNIKFNRLALLTSVSDVFRKLADFSKINV